MRGKLGIAGGVLGVWLAAFLVLSGVRPFGGAATSATTSASAPTSSPSLRPPTASAPAYDARPAPTAPTAPAASTAPAAPAAPGPSGTSGQGTALSRAGEAVDPQARAARRLARLAAGVRLPDPEQRRAAPVLPTLSMRLGSINVLGSSHTGAGREQPGMAPGPRRTRAIAGLVRDYRLDVVGLQELQPNQVRAFTEEAGDYTLYPGSSLGPLDGENSLAWRTDTWDLVEPGTVPVPYFNGRPRNMPVVLLRHRASGLMAWFVNVHNPADTVRFGGQTRWREAAKRVEVDLLEQLRASGLPVLVTGDMNEGVSWFCQVAARTRMVSSHGGSVGSGCVPPPGRRIDWIVGSLGIGFTGAESRQDPFVRSVTDHPVETVTATVRGSRFPRAVGTPEG